MTKRIAMTGVLLLAGCQYSNRSYIMDQVAVLPNGETISAVSEVHQQWGKPTESRGYVVWRRDGHDKELTQTIEKGWQHGEGWGTVHYSDDANRAWLTDGGKTIASFDYAGGTARLGPKDQPDWAR